MRKSRKSWPSIVLQVAAFGVAWFFGWFAAAAMVVLLVCAIVDLVREVTRAKIVGWREIAFGTISVTLFAAALRP